MQASVVVAHGLSTRTGSIVVVHGLICSVACGIFPDQRLKTHLLHGQVDYLPVSHQENPSIFLCVFFNGYFYSACNLYLTCSPAHPALCFTWQPVFRRRWSNIVWVFKVSSLSVHPLRPFLKSQGYWWCAPNRVLNSLQLMAKTLDWVTDKCSIVEWYFHQTDWRLVKRFIWQKVSISAAFTCLHLFSLFKIN